MAACVLAGVVVGAAWTWAQEQRYRADARVLVSGAGGRLMPALEALAEGSVVRSNVAQTLRLAAQPRVSAGVGEGRILTISVEAASRERARQIDAEVVTVFSRIAEQRFGSSAAVTTLDPAHAADQTSPTPARNLLIGALGGLVLGVVVAAASRRRPVASIAVGDAKVNRRLQARINEVTRRELLLAKKAAELALREQALAERRVEEDSPVARTANVEHERDLVADSSIDGLRRQPGDPASRWNLNELENLVAARHDVSAETADEWRTYLLLLRGHADANGTLPSGFDPLLDDVFGELAPFLANSSQAEAPPEP
ncbi:MAG: hypothetical protein ACJ74R_13725 [Gaiellaceae bacterium]